MENPFAKTDYKNDMQPLKVKSAHDDMSVHVVMSSEEDDEDEEQKTPLAQFGKINIKSAVMVEKNVNLSKVISPTGFLASFNKTQMVESIKHNQFNKINGS